jgi:hypothetical protein
MTKYVFFVIWYQVDPSDPDRQRMVCMSRRYVLDTWELAIGASRKCRRDLFEILPREALRPTDPNHVHRPEVTEIQHANTGIERDEVKALNA